MRSAECQVAAVVAAHFMGVVASDPLRRAASAQQVLRAFARLQEDLDQVPDSAHLALGPAVFHLLLLREHSHRGLLYPATMSL
jgi:hypothetical protein